MPYEIQLDSFQGPLEVLYQLIKKNRVEISEISLATIAEQYLDYMNQLKDFNLELASEFMVIAAELIELKIKYILPRRDDEKDEENDSDLVHRLHEYHYFKKISGILKKYEEESSKYHSRAVDLNYIIDSKIEVQLDMDLTELEDAYRQVLLANLKNQEEEDTEDRDEREWEQLNFEEIKIEDKTEYIVNRLKNTSRGISFVDLIENRKNKIEVVVTFLSILELAKLARVKIKQDKIFSSIHLHSLKR